MKDDQAIIEQVLAGDTESFAQIVTRYEGTVATIVRNMIQREDIATDVGQEVFIRLFKSLHQFSGKAKLSTYIGRIAINLSLNELKKQGRRGMDSIDGMLHLSDGSPEKQIKQFEDRELIAGAMRKMSPRYRSVLTLRMIEGYSTRETAEILNIPEGTVLSRLARAQGQLKKELEQLGYVHNE